MRKQNKRPFLQIIVGENSCIDHNRVVPEEEAEASDNKLNETAESESIENIMEEVERISREVKEGKEDDKKVSRILIMSGFIRF